MKDLVDTTEMYLRTIYELEEEGITPIRARIAERLEQSGPTVSQTVGRMERDGLVVVTGDRSLRMTPEGRSLAIAVMRKHRLAERLLTDIIGLDIRKVHDEACRWQLTRRWGMCGRQSPGWCRRTCGMGITPVLRI